MATTTTKDHSSASGSLKVEREISKKTSKNKKKMKNNLNNLPRDKADFRVQSLMEYAFSPQTNNNVSVCACRSLMGTPNNAPKCELCLGVGRSLFKRATKRAVLPCCRHCGNYSFPGVKTSCRALMNSPGLLNFLIEVFRSLLLGCGLVVTVAQFVPTDTPKRIRIILNFQLNTSTGEKVERCCFVEFIVSQHICPSCLPKDPKPKWSSVVQLRPRATYDEPSLSNLLIRFRHYQCSMPMVSCEKKGTKGIDVFFAKEKDAQFFINNISKHAIIKIGKVCKKKVSRTSMYRKFICEFFIPVCRGDLVFLPEKIAARVQRRSHNISRLFVSVRTGSSIKLVDPFSSMAVVVLPEEYFEAPFQPLKTQKDLVEFVVLNVEDSPEEESDGTFALADVEVARLSDFGKNDRVVSVRTHLGELLKPGDHAFGYDLERANFNNDEAEKCRDLLPDVVIARAKCKLIRVPRKAEKKKKKSPEYLEFLKNLEKNPEAMFNLSLNNGKDDERETSDPASVDVGLEDLLADLGLADEEADSSHKD